MLLVIRQGAEEEINRQTQTVLSAAIEQVQTSVEDGHLLVRRDHVDAGRLNSGAVLDLKDLHRRGALEQFHHGALVRRFQVLNNDKSYAAVCRNVPQEKVQCLQSAGRGANADDGDEGFSTPRFGRSDTVGHSAPSFRARLSGGVRAMAGFYQGVRGLQYS